MVDDYSSPTYLFYITCIMRSQKDANPSTSMIDMSFLLRFFRNAPVIRFQGGFTKKLIPDQYAETVMLRQTPVPKNNFPRFPHAPRLPRQQALAPVDS